CLEDGEDLRVWLEGQDAAARKDLAEVEDAQPDVCPAVDDERILAFAAKAVDLAAKDLPVHVNKRSAVRDAHAPAHEPDCGLAQPGHFPQPAQHDVIAQATIVPLEKRWHGMVLV